MFQHKSLFNFHLTYFFIFFFCFPVSKHAATETQIADDPAKMDDKVNENIKAVSTIRNRKITEK